MVSIYELLKEEKEKIEEINKLREDVVEADRLRDLDEGLAWTMDFKAIGATTDKLRSAAVKRKMNEFPNVAAQKKAKLANLELDLKFIRDTIRVMMTFETENIDFDKIKPEEKNVQ